jgi:hypothetical protein
MERIAKLFEEGAIRLPDTSSFVIASRRGPSTEPVAARPRQARPSGEIKRPMNRPAYFSFGTGHDRDIPKLCRLEIEKVNYAY